MATKRGRGKPKRYEGEESTRLSVLIRPRYRDALEIIARDRQSTISEAMELCIARLASEYTISDTNLLTRIMPELNFDINFNSYIDKGNLNNALLFLNKIMKEVINSEKNKPLTFTKKLSEYIDNPYLNQSSLTLLHKNIELFSRSEYFKVSNYSANLRTPKETYQMELFDLFDSDLPIDQISFFWSLFEEFYNTGFYLDKTVEYIERRVERAECKYDENTLTWNLKNFITFNKDIEQQSLTLDNCLDLINMISRMDNTYKSSR